MPRTKKFFEAMVARFEAGTFERIDAVLTPAEDRTEFVRAAVERELKRRKAKAKPTPLARVEAGSHPMPLPPDAPVLGGKRRAIAHDG